MSHSGGIVNFFDFDPLPKLKQLWILHLSELIATQDCFKTDHLATNSPLYVNLKPGVKTKGEIEEHEGERVSMTKLGWLPDEVHSQKSILIQHWLRDWNSSGTILA